VTSCGKPADPDPYRHPVTPSTRCPEALEIPLPDAGDGYKQSVLVLQCERDAGHPGTCRRPVDPRERRPTVPDSVIRTVTKWGVQLPDGQVRTADDAEDANRIRDMLRDTITEEFGVPMADYDPRIVQRTETTTTSEWVHTPFAGIEKGIT
jgi:hypothetical protein